MVLNCRDVVFSYSLRISNDVGASRHPIIVTIMNESDKVFGVVCTDKLNAKKHSNLVKIDWKAAGLKKPTVAICSKLVILDVGYIDKIIGRVSYEDFCKITNAISSMSTSLKLIERKSELDSGGIEPTIEGDDRGPTPEMQAVLESALRRMITSGDVFYSVDEAEAYMASKGDCEY